MFKKGNIEDIEEQLKNTILEEEIESSPEKDDYKDVNSKNKRFSAKTSNERSQPRSQKVKLSSLIMFYIGKCKTDETKKC